MYIVTSFDGNRYGILDTKDMVTEWYTRAELLHLYTKCLLCRKDFTIQGVFTENKSIIIKPYKSLQDYTKIMKSTIEQEGVGSEIRKLLGTLPFGIRITLLCDCTVEGDGQKVGWKATLSKLERNKYYYESEKAIQSGVSGDIDFAIWSLTSILVFVDSFDINIEYI